MTAAGDFLEVILCAYNIHLLQTNMYIYGNGKRVHFPQGSKRSVTCSTIISSEIVKNKGL